jgi:hypothetical protein
MIGLTLLAAAIVVVARQHTDIRAALHHVADQPAGERAKHIAVMLGSVLGNIALTAVMFRLLLSRFGRIGSGEMQAVIASATLINYLPLRPGFIGRVAYHKAMNGIAVRESIKTIVQAAILSALAALYLTAIVLICREHAISPWYFAAAPLPLLGVLGALSPSAARLLAWAGAVRLLDVLVTALRYHAAFALIGSPIDWDSAMAFACISVLATMVPLVSNGLGLREWAIGMFVPVVASYQMELGLTADLLNRAAELVMVTAAGVPATLWLAKRVRARRAAEDVLRSEK